MSTVDDLADALARDALKVERETGDEQVVAEVGRQLGASSSTMEEAYLTFVRVRRAEERARRFLEERITQLTTASETSEDH